MISIVEAATTTNVRRTRDAKIKALAGKEALNIAKTKGSPLYDKYNKFNRKRLFLKKEIMKKYIKMAERVAREKLSSPNSGE